MAKIMIPFIQDSKSFSSVDMITLIDFVTSGDKELCTTRGDREFKIETRDLKKDNNTTLITETEHFLFSK